MARFDAEPVLETRVLGVEALPFVLGFRAVDLEGAELLAVRAILGPGRELEEEKTDANRRPTPPAVSNSRTLASPSSAGRRVRVLLYSVTQRTSTSCSSV